MNGAQHYLEAEKLLTQAASKRFGDVIPDQTLLAEAQAHATLALAAATALAQGTAHESGEKTVWRRAAGVTYNDVHSNAE